MKLIDFYQTVSGTLEDFRAGRIGSKLAIEKIQYLNEKAAQHNLGVSIQDPDNILSHITIFDDERSYEDDRLLQRHGTNPKQSSKRDLLYRSSGGRSRPQG